VPVPNAETLSRRLLGRSPDAVEPLVVWDERATYRITLGTEAFVVKGEDPHTGHDNPEFANEIAGHQHALVHGVPAPELVAIETDAFAMRWVEGVPAHRVDTDAAWRAAAEVTHAIHALPPIGPFGTGFGDAAPSWFDALIAEVDFEAPRCIARGLDPYAVDRIRVELDLARAAITAEPVVWCHGDLQPDHILINPDTNDVTAVIDWSDHGRGDGAWDLALLTLDHDRIDEARSTLVAIYQRVRLLGEIRWLADHGFDNWRDCIARLTAGS
jgi:aminoglycoside phosphotransferase (APT) family kinase protein